MSGIEKFIKTKEDFKKSYEGLKNESRLITFDGVDGAGKTEILKRVIEKLKERFKNEGKNPDDIVYLKCTSLRDTNSQKNISETINKCRDENNFWDKNKIDYILNLWSAKLNRSYGDHILPLTRKGKTVILDRSEIDIFRAGIEWGNKELVDKIKEYMENGTLTHGITAANRIFVSSETNDAYKNLTERSKSLSKNDPRSLDEMKSRVKNEEEAEKLIVEIQKEKPNVIKVENKRIENEKERNVQFEKIAEKIISNLKL